MASEQMLDIPVRRHVLTSDRPFQVVLDGLDLDTVLALDPQAHQAGRRLVRLIAGNPVTMGQMTRHLPAAGSYAPITILIQQLPGGATQVAYDTVASAIAPYGDAAASQVAERLDTEVLSLLHQATGRPAER
jgi:hypothetical protein